MEANDVKNLMEAYTSVYSPQEEVEQLDEITRSMGRRATEYRRNQEQDAHMKRVNAHQEKMKNDPEYREKHENARKVHQKDQNESYDLFDTILEYLVSEGYADTNEAAIAIMANMSEEWKQSIIEQSNTLVTPEQRRADELKYGMKRTTQVPPKAPTAKVKSQRMPL